MAHDTTQSPLEADMARDGLSARALAKRLAGDDRRLDQERTNVRRWLNPDKGISEKSSARLAAIFGRPADYYVRTTAPRVRQADRLEELAERLAESIEAQAKLGREVKSLRGRLSRLEAQAPHRPDAATGNGQ